MFFQCFEQLGGKPEIAFHEVRRILRAVHSCKIENKVGFSAIFVKLFRGRVDIVFKYFVNAESGTGPVLVIAQVFESAAKVFAHKSSGSGHKDIHFACSSFLSSSRIYSSAAIFSFVCSTVRRVVLLELNSVSVLRSASPSLKYLS